MAKSQSSTPRYPGIAPIDAYGNGGFRFAGMSHKGSIMCLPDAITAWDMEVPEDLTVDSLRPILDARGRIDFALLGTGERHLHASTEVRSAFADAGISLDVMATGPAARTYNVLLAEGRRVAAALIATGHHASS